MKEMLEIMIKNLVENSDAVEITENQKENSVTATSTTIAMSDYEKTLREQYGGEISFGKDGKK